MNYILNKNNLHQILKKWSTHYEIFAPQKVEKYSEFLPFSSTSELAFGEPHNTRYPPKSLFLPQSEVLLKYTGRFGHLEEVLPIPQQRILFGIRPCDAQAMTLLDTVFSTDENSDPYWKNRRKNTLLIGLGCSEPSQTCFCTTVGGSPFNHTGLDALMTDMDDKLFIEVFSKEAEKLFSDLPVGTDDQLQAVNTIQENAVNSMTPAFDTTNLKQKLDHIFESNYWEKAGESCLGCGVCTFLCPTCFCFDIVDEVQRSERVRNWDTCMFRIYSQEASGHNPRPTRKERTRQRLMHKYSYWLDHIGQIGCTGCGRCVRYCPVGLDIRAMLRAAGSYESESVNA